MLLKLFYFLFEGITGKFIIQCFTAVCMGGLISFSLILSGQSWAKSFSNITTFCILPLIGLVITTVISGNIALSLGMVGALSIIRFRHPVKSPLELSIYFLLLTVGITISTAIGKAIFLTILSMLIIYSYAYYRNKQILKKIGFNDISMYREETKFLLEIISNEQNNFLAKSPNLLLSNENITNSTYIYKLCFAKKIDLENIKSFIEKQNGVLEIKFSQI